MHPVSLHKRKSLFEIIEEPHLKMKLHNTRTLNRLLTFQRVSCVFSPSSALLLASQRYKLSVYRRYSDFDVFHEVLLQRFAYRMVPSMPPKRMLKGGESVQAVTAVHTPHWTPVILQPDVWGFFCFIGSSCGAPGRQSRLA